ncbi:MAG: DUF4290 domain-containing protein [Bacteroidota bacterium]|nr:DUF4290 domain-containing protein [Bacteroidota bacterium]
MEYNTGREQLIIPEYGRHVQKMVKHATQIKDKKERKECVEAIIAFMGLRNPHLRDIKDFTHKLWDHLFIMSDFEIDVESPYAIPEKEKLEAKPEKMPYPKTKIKFPFYGINIEKMIVHACEMTDGELKEIMAGMIANHMKKDYLSWNKAFVDDDTILKHLDQLSDGKLKTNADFKLIDDRDIQKPKSYRKLKKKGKNYKYKKGFKKR